MTTPFLSVVTATYDRPVLLRRLAASLASAAEGTTLEWLVADDGSPVPVDAAALAALLPDSVDVRVFRGANGGKHRALNRVLPEIRGELAVVVDDDDGLLPGALDALRTAWSAAGAVPLGLIADSTDRAGRVIGMPLSPSLAGRTLHDILPSVRGDKTVVLRGDVYRTLRFPEIAGERFVAESSVWAGLYHAGPMLVLARPIEVVEYQPDGLSAGSLPLRIANPAGAVTVYALLHAELRTWRLRLRAEINYWRFVAHATRRYGVDWQRPALRATVGGPLARLAGWTAAVADRRRLGQ